MVFGYDLVYQNFRQKLFNFRIRLLKDNTNWCATSFQRSVYKSRINNALLFKLELWEILTLLINCYNQSKYGVKREEAVVLIDEMTYVSMHDIDFFFEFKVCWITLVECGQYKPMMVDVVRGELENKFEKENLDINFRNAKHIGQVSNSFIDRHYVSNPYSGAIRTPSSFVAHQQAIEVKFEESIDYENLASKNDFLDKKISDRLIVIISDEVDDAMNVDVDKRRKLGEVWKLMILMSNFTPQMFTPLLSQFSNFWFGLHGMGFSLNPFFQFCSSKIVTMVVRRFIFCSDMKQKHDKKTSIKQGKTKRKCK